MVGSDIQENKVYEQIEKRYRDNPSKQAKERRAARDCMRKGESERYLYDINIQIHII